MLKLAVNTKFNTKLNLSVNTLGNRILAYILDIIAISLYLFLVVQILSTFDLSLGEAFDEDRGRILWGWYSLIMIPVMFYTLISETVSGGYTLGKYLTKIKVVKIDGFQPSFVDFFIRWIFRIVDIYIVIVLVILIDSNYVFAFAQVLTGLVALIVISRSKKGQRLGDLVAGTTVVKAKQVKNIDITILEELKEDYQPQYPQVLKLSDNDARIIKEAYRTAVKMKNQKLMHQLVDKLESVMGVKCDIDERRFVSTVLKDFNYYTQQM
ncbi:RDD family protein [bacterium]|nr:RDD family protein [bacterium]